MLMGGVTETLRMGFPGKGNSLSRVWNAQKKRGEARGVSRAPGHSSAQDPLVGLPYCVLGAFHPSLHLVPDNDRKDSVPTYPLLPGTAGLLGAELG